MRVPVLLLVPLVALAGCQGLVDAFGGDDGDATAARIIESSFTEATFERLAGIDGPDQALAALFDARFEYTHGGADADPDDLQASYLDEEGTHRTKPLGRFTTASSLSAGDVVTIAGVHVASHLTVSKGSSDLVVRPAVEKDWFTLAGAPLPLAADPGALASWSMEGSGGMRLAIEDDTVEVDGERIDIRDFLYDLSSRASGDMDLRFEADALTFSGDMAGDVALELAVDASRTMDGQTVGMKGAVDGTAEWDADGKTVYTFARGELVKVGASGSVHADASYDGYMEMDGEREELDDRDVPHPLVDENLPYTEEDVGLDGLEDPMVIDFFTRLWSADLAVGDRISITVDQDGLALDYEVEVAGADSRDLAGKALPTFRVLERMSYDAPGADPITSEATYWVDRESHLPVFAQIEESHILGAEDLQGLMGVTDLPLDLPDLEIVYTTKGTFRLEEHQEGLAVPGLLAMQGLRSGGVMGGAAAMSIPGMGFPAEGMDVSAPEVSFTKDEADDRLTVVRASAGLDWSEFMLRADGAEGMYLALNGPASEAGTRVSGHGTFLPMADLGAGDFLSFCVSGSTASDVEVMLTHVPSNALTGSHTFSSIAAC